VKFREYTGLSVTPPPPVQAIPFQSPLHALFLLTDAIKNISPMALSALVWFYSSPRHQRTPLNFLAGLSPICSSDDIDPLSQATSGIWSPPPLHWVVLVGDATLLLFFFPPGHQEPSPLFFPTSNDLPKPCTSSPPSLYWFFFLCCK